MIYLKSVLTVVTLLVFCTSLAQNVVHFKKANGKQKVVDLDKVFAVNTDHTFFEGRVIGHDGINLQMSIPSDSGGADKVYNIPVSTISQLWLCKKRTDEKCNKWKENQSKNEIILGGVMVPLFAGNLVSVASNRHRLSGAFLSAMAVIFSTYATINNPKIIKLKMKYNYIIQ